MKILQVGNILLNIRKMFLYRYLYHHTDILHLQDKVGKYVILPLEPMYQANINLAILNHKNRRSVPQVLELVDLIELDNNIQVGKWLYQWVSMQQTHNKNQESMVADVRSYQIQLYQLQHPLSSMLLVDRLTDD
jgi:hypothetical protein